MFYINLYMFHGINFIRQLLSVQCRCHRRQMGVFLAPALGTPGPYAHTPVLRVTGLPAAQSREPALSLGPRQAGMVLNHGALVSSIYILST